MSEERKAAKQGTAVSIIVPFLDTAQYLTECLESIRSQTMTEFEVLCYDGGSTDGSRKIAEEYAKLDSRFKLAEGAVAPLSAARNAGIRLARGKYIAFIDGDDTALPQMLAETVSLAEETNAELVCFSCVRYDSITDRTISGLHFLDTELVEENGLFDRDTKPESLFKLSNRKPFARLWRADFMRKNDLVFTDDGYYDDIVPGFISLERAERIACIRGPLYCHRKRRESRVHDRWADAGMLLRPIRTVMTTLRADGCSEAEMTGFAEKALELLTIALENSPRPEYVRQLLAELTASRDLQSWLRNCEVLMPPEAACQLLSLRGALDQFDQLCSKPKNGKATLLAGQKKTGGCALTLILPVYQSADYLREAMDSILGQTFRDMEVLCIDDGSTDGSLEILLQYAAKDERVCVYSQPHLGVGDARNAGLAEAAGEYIYFMDSDDILVQQALETVVRTAREGELDALYFDADAFYDERCGEKERAFRPVYARRKAYPAVTDGLSLFADFCDNREFFVTLWNALYRREMLEENRLRFVTRTVHNDTDFTFRAVCSAKRAGYLKERLYRRRIRPGSIITSANYFRSAYSFYVVGNVILSSIREYAGKTDERVRAHMMNRARLAYNNAQKDFARCSPYDRGKMYALTDDGGLFRKLIAEPVLREEERRREAEEKARTLEEYSRKAAQLEAELEKIRGSRAYRLALRLQRLLGSGRKK